MTQIDPKAVHKSEKRLRSCAGDWRLFPYQTAPDDMKLLSRAYLDLTDPTPLTVEVLVGMGGIENPKSELCYRFGKLCVYADGLPEEWEWTYGNDGIHDVPSWLSPRTAGELRQLLRRLEPPHAAR